MEAIVHLLLTADQTCKPVPMYWINMLLGSLRSYDGDAKDNVD